MLTLSITNVDASIRLSPWIIGSNSNVSFQATDDKEDLPAQQQQSDGRSDGVCDRIEQIQHSGPASGKTLGVIITMSLRISSKQQILETTQSENNNRQIVSNGWGDND